MPCSRRLWRRPPKGGARHSRKGVMRLSRLRSFGLLLPLIVACSSAEEDPGPPSILPADETGTVADTAVDSGSPDLDTGSADLDTGMATDTGTATDTATAADTTVADSTIVDTGPVDTGTA